MIYGNIQTLSDERLYPVAIQRALKYLAETDVAALEFGVHEPDDVFSVQVIDLTTKERSTTKAEIHREKLDLHFSLTGEETVYGRVAPTDQPETDEQFAELDIGFFDMMDEELELRLNVGDFVIFFPGEVHRPGCQKDKLSAIKKIVVKMRGADVNR
ncbi:MAG: YhcH/YjgK/YiaL family protein [Spirochaeta sp.]|jgi:biofilm protein TabA|nr:YhcH/YjgK/YiaL family protein [Spirochaeta sp.]